MKGRVGHGERETRDKQRTLVITAVKYKRDPHHPSMVLLEFIFAVEKYNLAAESAAPRNELSATGVATSPKDRTSRSES